VARLSESFIGSLVSTEIKGLQRVIWYLMWWDISQLNTIMAHLDKMPIHTTEELRMDYIAPNSAADLSALF
jgi:hypothetical protein